MSEALDRRLFLRGLMLTSAGLVVPKPPTVFVPVLGAPIYFKPDRIIVPKEMFIEWTAYVASHPEFHRQMVYGQFSVVQAEIVRSFKMVRA